MLYQLKEKTSLHAFHILIRKILYSLYLKNISSCDSYLRPDYNKIKCSLLNNNENYFDSGVGFFKIELIVQSTTSNLR